MWVQLLLCSLVRISVPHKDLVVCDVCVLLLCACGPLVYSRHVTRATTNNITHMAVMSLGGTTNGRFVV